MHTKSNQQLHQIGLINNLCGTSIADNLLAIFICAFFSSFLFFQWVIIYCYYYAKSHCSIYWWAFAHFINNVEKCIISVFQHPCRVEISEFIMRFKYFTYLCIMKNNNANTMQTAARVSASNFRFNIICNCKQLFIHFNHIELYFLRLHLTFIHKIVRIK